jgi:hypothetical protein
VKVTLEDSHPFIPSQACIGDVRHRVLGNILLPGASSNNIIERQEMVMATPKCVLMLPIAAALLVLSSAAQAQAQACGGPGPQGSWCYPQPGFDRGYERYGDRRDDWRYRERRYDERRRFSGDECWQLSPRGTRVWVCR